MGVSSRPPAQASLRRCRCRNARVLLAVLLAAAGSQPVAAQVQSLHDARGNGHLHRPACPDVGAVEQTATGPPAAGAKAAQWRLRAQPSRPGSGDSTAPSTPATPIAWRASTTGPGCRAAAAYDVLERLDAHRAAPLVGIVPVMPAEPRRHAADRRTRCSCPRWHRTVRAAAPAQAGTGGAARGADAGQRHHAIAHTVFGLQKHFGCWWIKG